MYILKNKYIKFEPDKADKIRRPKSPDVRVGLEDRVFYLLFINSSLTNLNVIKVLLGRNTTPLLDMRFQIQRNFHLDLEDKLKELIL